MIEPVDRIELFTRAAALGVRIDIEEGDPRDLQKLSQAIFTREEELMRLRQVISRKIISELRK